MTPRLPDETQGSHGPVRISGNRGAAVLVGEDDRRAIRETLHLISIPGLRESILKGMATLVDGRSDKFDW